MDPAKFERAVGKSSVTNFELQINDSEGFLAFVETLKTDRSKACMSVPTQVGARTLQLSKLMMEKAYYLHMRRLFPKMRLLFTDTDSVMVQIFELQDPLHAKANLNGAALFDVAGKSKDPERDLSALSAAARAKAIEVMGQLGKLGDETFPARILEYVGLRSKMYSILTVQPDGARKEKRKIKGVPKKAVTNVRHLEYREVLEEGSERRAAFAQLRSRAHEIAVETVEKKLSPFNDKVYGLDAHNSRPLGHWSSCGCWALTLRQALRPSRGHLRCMSQGGRWAIRAAARQGVSSSAHAAGFSRKAAEEVILSSCGGSKSLRKRESEKTRKRELGIFLFFRFRQSTPSSGSAAAAVSERAPEAGPTRNSITRTPAASHRAARLGAPRRNSVPYGAGAREQTSPPAGGRP